MPGGLGLGFKGCSNSEHRFLIVLLNQEGLDTKVDGFVEGLLVPGGFILQDLERILSDLKRWSSVLDILMLVSDSAAVALDFWID